MSADDREPRADGRRCEWMSQADALHAFASFTGATESAGQIKPLHWFVASRLVVEGGFHPNDVTPRPPFVVERRGSNHMLSYDPSVATGSERTILGGLKTKNVDVVVTRDGVGPVLAVSCKGVTGALRNLTNRMEETVGECTNLHITYPALVLGYYVVLRANAAVSEVVEDLPSDDAPPARKLTANDIAVRAGGEPVEGVLRFYAALRELTGRRGVRDDGSRYEAIAFAMVDMSATGRGGLLSGFPKADSPLRAERFFDALYARYDERFVYSAPRLGPVTRRLEWSPESPAFRDTRAVSDRLGFGPRLAAE